VQQVKDAENILLIKAATSNFPETNLSVITSDGSLYTFTVCYDMNPLQWVYQLPVQSKASMEMYANGLLDNPATIKGISDKQLGLSARLAGIYIKNHVLYYQVEIKNESPIDYSVDYLRFYIRDQKRFKRTAVQELELTPLYTAGNTSLIETNSKTIIVVALERFIIPDQKYFVIEIGEKNSGRNLSMKVGNKHILRAIVLPDWR
jgi:conjugative transposon TraN protein